MKNENWIHENELVGLIRDAISETWNRDFWKCQKAYDEWLERNKKEILSFHRVNKETKI